MQNHNIKESFIGYKTKRKPEGRMVVSTAPKKQTQSLLRKIGYNLADAVATEAIERLRTKGGAPDFDIDTGETIYGRYSNDDDGNGRGKGKDGRGKGNSGKSNRRRTSKSSDSGGVRGYKSVSGQSCLLWNSGIKSGLTVNTRIVTEDYTPIYLSSGWLFKVTDASVNPFTYYISELSNIIYPFIESIISNTINRYAGRYININKFMSYINALTDSLQVYYCIDNVLTYRSNVTIDNTNVGMEVLSTKLSSEAIVEYSLLQEVLMTSHCPRNLLEFIRFMCQAYRTSDAPHSSIIKLNIGGMFDDNWKDGTSNQIETMLKDCRLSLIKANEINSYLSQAFPEWLIGVLPPSSMEACFNKDFMLFWHNQNCCYLSTDEVRKKNNQFDYTQQITSIDEYIDYQINTRDIEVDGMIFVSNCYLIKAEGSKEPDSYWGIWQPLASVDGKEILSGNTSDSFNIKCLDKNGKIKPILNYTVLSASGIHFLVQYSGDVGKNKPELIQFGTHGFVKLQNVSVRMQNEAFNNAMRFLYI